MLLVPIVVEDVEAWNLRQGEPVPLLKGQGTRRPQLMTHTQRFATHFLLVFHHTTACYPARSDGRGRGGRRGWVSK